MHNETTCPHIDHKECLSLVQLKELKAAQEKHQGDIEALLIDLAASLDREKALREAIQAIVDCTMEPEGEISCACIEHAKSLL